MNIYAGAVLFGVEESAFDVGADEADVPAELDAWQQARAAPVAHGGNRYAEQGGHLAGGHEVGTGQA